MVIKALGFLAGVVALSVALGIAGLLGSGVVDAQTAPSASRTISPSMVSPGGQVVVRITASRFTGQIREKLPTGFTYVANSITSSSAIIARVEGQYLVITVRNNTEHSYTVTASDTAGSYSFSGELRYLDNNDNLQPPSAQAGITVTGDTDVTVGGAGGTPTVAPTMTPTPTPTAIPTNTPRPTPVQPTEFGASRAISSERVIPGGEVMVTVTTAGFTGQITETLPAGFSYNDMSVASVPPGDAIRARTDGQDVIFTVRGTTQFSYMVTVSDMVGGYRFSGGLTYLDSNDEPQSGGMIAGHSRVAVAPAGINIDRAFNSSMVSPGGEVIVTITSSGFGDGQVTEMLPSGFSYKDDSVTPGDIRVRTDGQDVVFTVRGAAQFSYTAMASSVVDDHLFSGSLTYLDENDDPQGGGPVTGADTVTVRVPPTPTPTPTVAPTATPMPTPVPARRRGGGGGGGGGSYPQVFATTTPTPAPTRVLATPTPMPVPTIIVPTFAPTATPVPTPEPTATPVPTAAPPTAAPTPRPTAVVVVPTVEPTKPPEPTEPPAPTATSVPPTEVPPTEVPPTAVPPTEAPPTAMPAPTVTPPVAPPEATGMPTWLIVLIIVVIVGVVIVGVGYYLMRMRR